MPRQSANGPDWHAGRNGADIDHQADRRDEIEAAVRWIQARQALFKRIAASQARTDRLRARKNGKMKAPQVGSLAESSRRRT